MFESIETDKLIVEAATGRTEDDPHGQGFAAAVARFVSINPILIAKAKMNPPLKMLLTVKCGMLEVDGVVSKTELVRKGVRFILYLYAIRFKNPTAPHC